jgi:hypothetical protein
VSVCLTAQSVVTDKVRSISSNTVAQPVARVAPVVQQPSSTATPPAPKEAPAAATAPDDAHGQEPKKQLEQPASQVKQEPEKLPHQKHEAEQKRQQPSEEQPVVRKVPTATQQPSAGPGSPTNNSR